MWSELCIIEWNTCLIHVKYMNHFLPKQKCSSVYSLPAISYITISETILSMLHNTSPLTDFELWYNASWVREERSLAVNFKAFRFPSLIINLLTKHLFRRSLKRSSKWYLNEAFDCIYHRKSSKHLFLKITNLTKCHRKCLIICFTRNVWRKARDRLLVNN